MKYNKFFEFIFGQLDYFFFFRLNVFVFANEVYFMYVFNKISEWLRKLLLDEREKIIENFRKGGREIRKFFKDRL